MGLGPHKPEDLSNAFVWLPLSQSLAPTFNYQNPLYAGISLPLSIFVAYQTLKMGKVVVALTERMQIFGY